MTTSRPPRNHPQPSRGRLPIRRQTFRSRPLRGRAAWATIRYALPRVGSRSLISDLEQELDGVAEQVLDLLAELRMRDEIGIGVEDGLGSSGSRLATTTGFARGRPP